MRHPDAGAGAKGSGFTLFATPEGTCGVAWDAGAIRAVQLPEGSRATARERLASCGLSDEATPPPWVAALVDALGALLGGEPVDLGDVPLDWTGVAAFRRRVYEAARSIPFGETATYGELAEWLGAPGAARAVGQALGRNPVPLVVPCHRVVGAHGIGGFSATGGVALKRRLLELEADRVRP